MQWIGVWNEKWINNLGDSIGKPIVVKESDQLLNDNRRH
jgi:hypothetical protein